jgi:D-alanyl-D-alanine carboxypeptidase
VIRKPLTRLVAPFAMATLFASFASAPANALGPSVVVDVATGTVLEQNMAGEPWYPASLTKLMTVYVVLKKAREGRFTLSSGITMTQAGARQAPSRMGFPPGAVFTVENALKILMVKSANDVAHAVAENVGGSVEGFTALMNQEAARLGMTGTRFINPHGLPGKGQKTTARDLSILALALLREFPEQSDLWHLPAIRYGEFVTRNHNHLVGRYPGTDGMKTGFICSAGFNVVASASRDGRQLVAVVLGAPSARERSEMAAAMFEREFSGWNRGGTPVQALQNLPGEARDMRDVICRKKGKRGPGFVDDSAAFDLERARASSGGGDVASPYAALLQQNAGRNAVNAMAGDRPRLLQPYSPPGDPVEVGLGGATDLVRPVAVPAFAAAPVQSQNPQPMPANSFAAAPPPASGAIGRPQSPMRLGPDTLDGQRASGSLYTRPSRSAATPPVAPATVMETPLRPSVPAPTARPRQANAESLKPAAKNLSDKKSKPDTKAKPKPTIVQDDD